MSNFVFCFQWRRSNKKSDTADRGGGGGGGGGGMKEGLQYMSRGVTSEMILHMNFQKQIHGLPHCMKTTPTTV